MRTLTPGRLASKRQNNASGLTLIELMVAMAIVGLIFAVAAVGLRSAFNVNLKKTASSLASTLRYLSNKAVTEHQYLRMVYDLDEQSYHVEASENPFVVSSEPEEEEKKPAEEETPEDSEEAEEEADESKPVFTQLESRLLKPKKLPSDVFFKDVTVSYILGKREQGQVFTYFFPDGFATPTLINLRNEEDVDYFSVELFPLSGRVKITSEYRETLTEEKK